MKVTEIKDSIQVDATRFQRAMKHAQRKCKRLCKRLSVEVKR